MRVQLSQQSRKRRTLSEENPTHSRADSTQAQGSRGQACLRDFRTGSRQRAGDQRGHLPSLEEPLRWHADGLHEAPEGSGVRERSPEKDSRRPGGRHKYPQGDEPGKLLSPARRRAAVEHVRRKLGVSERRACEAVGQSRSSQRYVGEKARNDRALVERMVGLSRQNPRYGYRRVWALLRREGWSVNKKRVHRLWREEGLKVPGGKQLKTRRLLEGGSENGCTRKRAGHKDHAWSYDFVMDETEDGRRLKMMPVVDEHTRECLAIEVERSITAEDVIGTLAHL